MTAILLTTKQSLEYYLDELSLDEAISYLQNLRDSLNAKGDSFKFSLDCVDDITGTTALNLYQHC